MIHITRKNPIKKKKVHCKYKTMIHQSPVYVCMYVGSLLECTNAAKSSK